MTIDPIFVQLTADVVGITLLNILIHYVRAFTGEYVFANWQLRRTGVFVA